MGRVPLTLDETNILTITDRYPTRGLSASDLAGEAALDPTIARRTAEGLVAKGLLVRRGSLYRQKATEAPGA
jgi:DNA-binding MarR family transcriptional regulator